MFVEILQKSYKPYTEERNEQFQSIVKFDCRGLEPVDFDIRVVPMHFLTSILLPLLGRMEMQWKIRNCLRGHRFEFKGNFYTLHSVERIFSV
jgi:hypothetical protein